MKPVHLVLNHFGNTFSRARCTESPQIEVKPATGEVRHVFSSDTYVVQDAKDQLTKSAQLPDVKVAVGFPDLHPGKGIPVGAAIGVKNRIFPHLIGNDIGCGMALHQLGLAIRGLSIERLSKKLKGLESSDDPDHVEALLKIKGLPNTAANSALGTIGGGNHFAEIQAIDEVLDTSQFRAMGLDEKAAFLTIHSGSRGFGEAVLQRFIAKSPSLPSQGIASDTPEAQAYLNDHDDALKWATLNRTRIGERLCDQLGLEHTLVSDTTHNAIEKLDTPWGELLIHRKGAAPANAGAVVVPGSRGDYSYLVNPVIGEDTAKALYSLSHGAGRKYARSVGREKIEKRFKVEQLRRTALGSQVICEQKDLLFEEAPENYKSIQKVLADLVEFGLVKPIAKLRPLLTYKTRAKSSADED
jgi:release factor H-coupled RctB family protein